MGLVNDRLAPDMLPPHAALPHRGIAEELGYPALLNASRELVVRNLRRGFGARPALRCGGAVWTYDELWDRVTRLSHSMSTAGLGPGDRVLIHLFNGPEFIESWLATLQLGAIAVATVPALGPSELSTILAETTPRCAITQEQLLPTLQRCKNVPSTCVIVGLAESPNVSYDAWVDQPTRHEAGAETSADDVALIAYTSGSTGSPKGTLHTHADVLASADCYAAEVLEPKPDDVFFCAATMGFTYALGALLIFPLRFGACSVLERRPFHPRYFLATVVDAGVTLLFVGPTSSRLLMEHAACRSPETWRRVRRVVSAGERLSSDTHRRWRELTQTELLDGCGSTEMLHIWISQRPGESEGGCVGRPVRLYAARLHDEDGHLLSAPEAEGHLAIKGPTGCRYWMNPELQCATVRDGWTFTKDRFRRDARGRYWHLGREDDLIVSAGCKISPLEVEEVLLLHPRVKQAAVVGVGDRTSGQAVHAFVVPDGPGSEEQALASDLRGHVRDHLATFKCPQKIKFVRELPRTSTGKLNRRALR